MEKIFCIGFPKTGTTSLEEAFELLGYSVCKGYYNNYNTNYLISLFINKDFTEIDRVITYYDVFTDLPFGGTNFYVYLSNTYPDAKFIHTQRDPEKWYDSLVKMFTQFDVNLDTAMNSFHKQGRYGVVYYFNKIFKVNTLSNNKGEFIAHYNRINNEIKNYFENSTFSYLGMNLIDGDGWEVLCPFLNCTIPNVKFPHKNKAKSKKRLTTIEKLQRIKILFIKIFKTFAS